MASKKVTIVGAGISGLTAAITARRMGYEVRVLEKFSRAGGVPGGHPTVDSTPLDPALLTRWLGVPIGEPQLGPAECMHVYVFGKKYELNPGHVGLHNVERGPRHTCIDRYLAGVAVEMGATIEYDSPVHSQADLAELPPGTIIATGPYTEMFRALRIPFEVAFGYTMRNKFTENGARSGRRILAAYFDSYTRDYAYVASINGIVFGLLFSRTPVSREALSVWRRQLEVTEGVSFNQTDSMLGFFSSKYPNSTRLFHGDKILAGGLAGAQDPGTYFGCHGGLVSGKIAAIALEDKALAAEMFRCCNRSYNAMWLGRRVAINYSPTPVRRFLIGRGMKHASDYEVLGRIVGASMKRMIPGYLLLESRMERYEPQARTMEERGCGDGR